MIRGVTIAVAVFIIFAAFLINLALEQRNNQTSIVRGAGAQVEEQAPVSKITNFPLPPVAELSDRVERVLAMQDAAEFGDDVRMKDLSEPEALEILEQLREYGGGIHKLLPAGPLDTNSLQIQGMRVIFKNEAARECLALLTPDSSGRWQLDLGALVAKGDVEWDKYRATQEVEGVFRATVRRDNYFNGEFADDQKWESYRLSHPHSNDVIVGYCERESAARKALDAMLEARSQARVIVRLKTAPISRGASQATILSVLADEWILTNVPYDEEFIDPPSPDLGEEEESPLQPL